MLLGQMDTEPNYLVCVYVKVCECIHICVYVYVCLWHRWNHLLEQSRKEKNVNKRVEIVECGRGRGEEMMDI